MSTLGTGPAGVVIKSITKSSIRYPDFSYPPDRGSVFGPQQAPPVTSGGGPREVVGGCLGVSLVGNGVIVCCGSGFNGFSVEV